MSEPDRHVQAASSFQLTRNPLHFSSSDGRFSKRDDSDDEEGLGLQMPPQQMTLTFMGSNISSRSLLSSSSRRTSSSTSKIKAFFDALVNMPSHKDELSLKGRTDQPRLVYIRDFPTLAASSDTWYTPLLSAVRARRRGPVSKPSSTVACPMTIIFGMTPSLLPPLSPTSASESSLVLMSRISTQISLPSMKLPKADCGEDEAAEKAREKRLRERLKKWEKSDAGLQSEFSPLYTGPDAEEEEGKTSKPDLILIRASPQSMFGHQLSTSQAGKSSPHDKSSFFRSSVLVPTSRSPMHEKSNRIARRREINELTMRMGIGAIGGQVEEGSISLVSSEVAEPATEGSPHLSRTNHKPMWEEWGNKIELWLDVRRIADRAVGNIMSNNVLASVSNNNSLEPTIVPWPYVENAWASHMRSLDVRKQWSKEVSLLCSAREEDQEEAEDSPKNVNEVVERLKNDVNIDGHEERLLSCIVNPGTSLFIGYPPGSLSLCFSEATMPTSFSQVHLPAHTIDSVRTLVSLPILHPQAFKQGILKEHSMTGCLLFGPPGTGKTLVVRALAKEAGCHMLAVSPSDVMDMVRVSSALYDFILLRNMPSI